MVRPWQLMLLILAVVAEARRGGRGGGDRWKPIQPLDSQQECGSEFHDPQSKWLQATLVVRARWRSTDKHRADAQGAFNVTVTVVAMLKPWRRDLSGLRITIGQFNRSLGQRQRSLQRKLCAPPNLPRHASSGYIFFLTPTSDADYFRHSFLPVKSTQSNQRKIERIQCREIQYCHKKPELTQGAQLRGGGGSRLRRLVCAARGQPLPKVHWFKDGAEVQQSSNCVAQFRTKSGTVTARLTLRNDAASAGNYSCLFRNLLGSATSSLALDGDAIKQPPARRNLCDNATKCLNGGTCTIDALTKKPVCICSTAGTNGTAASGCVDLLSNCSAPACSALHLHS